MDSLVDPNLANARQSVRNRAAAEEDGKQFLLHLINWTIDQTDQVSLLRLNLYYSPCSLTGPPLTDTLFYVGICTS